MAGNFLAKTVGLAALGIAGYDSFKTTQRLSDRYVKQCQLERVDDTFLRTDSIASESTVTKGMYKWARNWRLGGNRLLNFKDRISSYISGFIDQFGNNAATFALGAIALLTGPKGSKFTKFKIPYVGKIAASILGIRAGVFVLRDLFGIGASNPRRME